MRSPEASIVEKVVVPSPRGELIVSVVNKGFGGKEFHCCSSIVVDGRLCFHPRIPSPRVCKIGNKDFRLFILLHSTGRLHGSSSRTTSLTYLASSPLLGRLDHLVLELLHDGYALTAHALGIEAESRNLLFAEKLAP